jgi:hypothetical protein
MNVMGKGLATGGWLFVIGFLYEELEGEGDGKVVAAGNLGPSVVSFASNSLGELLRRIVYISSIKNN